GSGRRRLPRTRATGPSSRSYPTFRPTRSRQLRSRPTARGCCRGGGGVDTEFRRWDGATGVLIPTFRGHAKAVESVAFSPVGERVLSGSIDRTIKVWDAATGALLHTFKGHSESVRAVAISPNGTLVLSGNPR